MSGYDDFKEGSAADAMLQSSSRGKGSRKGWLVFLLMLLLAFGIIIGVYSLGLMDSLMAGGDAAKTGEGGAVSQSVASTRQSKVVSPTVFFDLPVMIVNLNSSNPDTPRKPILKILVCLELSNPTDQQTVEQVMPRIIDSFQVYLRELRPGELSGSSGLVRLREELIARINHATHPVLIKDVLFKEMLVQ